MKEGVYMGPAGQLLITERSLYISGANWVYINEFSAQILNNIELGEILDGWIFFRGKACQR